jgi:hypothetical protein
MTAMGNESFYIQQDMTFDQSHRYLQETRVLLMESEDNEEGIAAFVENRSPTGRPVNRSVGNGVGRVRRRYRTGPPPSPIRWQCPAYGNRVRGPAGRRRVWFLAQKAE